MELLHRQCCLPATCLQRQGHNGSADLPDDHGGASTLVAAVGDKPVHADLIMHSSSDDEARKLGGELLYTSECVSLETRSGTELIYSISKTDGVQCVRDGESGCAATNVDHKPDQRVAEFKLLAETAQRMADTAESETARADYRDRIFQGCEPRKLGW